MKSIKIYNEKMKLLKKIDEICYYKIKNKIYFETKKSIFFCFISTCLLLCSIFFCQYLISQSTKNTHGLEYFLYSIFIGCIIYLIFCLLYDISFDRRNAISKETLSENVLNELNIMIETEKEELVLNNILITTKNDPERKRL